MDFGKVLAAVRLVGAATPAFEALFEQVKGLFNLTQQDQLQDAYDKAREASNDAQDDFTKAGRGK